MAIDKTIAALADPTRRELLHRLASNPCRAGDLARGFAISRPAVCKHTRILGRAGLIRAKKIGRERIYELAPGGRDAVGLLIKKLEEVGAFWDTALGAFKRYLEEKQ
ncbi:MAG TPA: metalloregulator ArsR/SmtB family transcription factor [Candidatus Acidoferrales bacterium]|nr:metalloregulator ArsR/SmtB family transcription factor [Candidatus Acidoferrales bacterium]